MARPRKRTPEDTGFSRWLDNELQQPDVSPSRVAEAAGITPAYLSMLRNGRRKPSFSVVEKLARALGTSVETAWLSLARASSSEKPESHKDKPLATFPVGVGSLSTESASSTNR